MRSWTYLSQFLRVFLPTLEQLTHSISMYYWNILGLCEMRWKKTLVRCQKMTDTRFISVEKRTDLSIVLDFLYIRS